ncbi:MAG: 3-hydroxyacyl-CoA dehydrogenase [Alphaproteobacteria bacterium]|nr:3-hydroxyacyl-CoA dehydrogenase [Alphaproteobacteria bacterium]
MTDQASGLRLGIVGAGAMGSGIAQVALQGGLEVVLFDAKPDALPGVRDRIHARLDRLVEKGEAAAETTVQAKAGLRLANGLADLAQCSIVIEAVFEDLDIKRALLRELEAVVAEDAIIASNTSSLPIAALARGCMHRRRIAGMHFFNPVPLMRLVEVIRGADTDDEVVERLVALGRRMGRTPVVVKDAPGFLVNLGGRAFATEALHIAQEGVAEPAAIDAVMRDCCGFRMGPFELMDLTGIDVNYPATEVIYRGYQHDPRLKTAPLHESLFHAGRHGRKTGIGFYRYGEGGRPLRAAEPEPAGLPARRLFLPEADDRLLSFAVAAGVDAIGHDDGTSPIVIAPLGEDCTTACIRVGLDHRRTVAIDLSHDTSKRLTIMSAPGADPEAASAVAAMLRASGRAVTRINDGPGFIAQRITAMIANLGCEMAQIGLASPADIDTAMRLGLNYPAGPLALADSMGVATVHTILTRLQEITGSDRYRPSLWLRRRALLGLSANTPE